MSLLNDEWNKAIETAAVCIEQADGSDLAERIRALLRPSVPFVEGPLVSRLTGDDESEETLGLAHVIADHAFWTGDEPPEPAKHPSFVAYERLRSNLATVTRNFYASLGGARIQIEVKHGADPDGERRITGAVVTLFGIPFTMDAEVFANLVGACLMFKSQIVAQQKRDAARHKAAEKAAKWQAKHASKEPRSVL